MASVRQNITTEDGSCKGENGKQRMRFLSSWSRPAQCACDVTISVRENTLVITLVILIFRDCYYSKRQTETVYVHIITSKGDNPRMKQ